MILIPDGIISTDNLNIEVNGVLQRNVTRLNTETGEAKILALDEKGTPIVFNEDLVEESVVFPLDNLHVYLVKPKGR